MSLFPDDRPQAARADNRTRLAAAARGSQYADVFTLTKANRSYLLGQRSTPASGLWGTTAIIMIVALVIAASGIFIYVSVGGVRNEQIALVYLFMAVSFAAAVISIPYLWWRYLRFLRRGQLVFGEVTRTDGRWMAIGRSHTYTVTVHYEVTLPDGGKVYGKEARQRDDLGRSGLPPQRTRIAALYNPASGRTYLL